MINPGNCRQPCRDMRARPLRSCGLGQVAPGDRLRLPGPAVRPGDLACPPACHDRPARKEGLGLGEQCAPRRSRGARSRRFVSAPAAIRTRVSRAERSAQSSSRSVSRCHPGPPFASCPVGPAAPTRPSALPAVRAQGSLGGPLPKRQGRTRSKERLQLTRAKAPPSHSCPRSGLAGALASRSS